MVQIRYTDVSPHVWFFSPADASVQLCHYNVLYNVVSREQDPLNATAVSGLSGNTLY